MKKRFFALLIILLLCSSCIAHAELRQPGAAKEAKKATEVTEASKATEAKFYLRDGITWETSPEALKALFPDAEWDEESLSTPAPILFLTCEGEISVSRYTADGFGGAFCNDEPLMFLYCFFSEDANRTMYLNQALTQKYGAPIDCSPERVLFVPALMGGDLSADDLADIACWELPDGTFITHFSYPLIGYSYIAYAHELRISLCSDTLNITNL